MSQVTLRQPSERETIQEVYSLAREEAFSVCFRTNAPPPRLPDATELGEENVTKISRNVGDADHHVSLALPSAVSGLAAKMRMTSVHVHTPLGTACGDSDTYTLCTLSRAIVRIVSTSVDSGRARSPRAPRVYSPTRRARDVGFRPGFVGGDAGPSGAPGGGLGARPEVSDHTFSRKKSPTGTARRRRLSGESNRRASLTLSDPTTIRWRRSSTGTPLTSQLFMMAKHAAVGRSDVTATTPQDDEAKPNVSMVVTCGKAPS